MCGSQPRMGIPAAGDSSGVTQQYMQLSGASPVLYIIHIFFLDLCRTMAQSDIRCVRVTMTAAQSRRILKNEYLSREAAFTACVKCGLRYDTSRLLYKLDKEVMHT